MFFDGRVKGKDDRPTLTCDLRLVGFVQTHLEDGRAGQPFKVTVQSLCFLLQVVHSRPQSTRRSRRLLHKDVDGWWERPPRCARTVVEILSIRRINPGSVGSHCRMQQQDFCGKVNITSAKNSPRKTSPRTLCMEMNFQVNIMCNLSFQSESADTPCLLPH